MGILRCLKKPPPFPIRSYTTTIHFIPDFSGMVSTAKHIQIEKVQQIDNNYDICIFFIF